MTTADQLAALLARAEAAETMLAAAQDRIAELTDVLDGTTAACADLRAERDKARADNNHNAGLLYDALAAARSAEESWQHAIVGQSAGLALRQAVTARPLPSGNHLVPQWAVNAYDKATAGEAVAS
jgi:cytolysin (calcineurin-like family phosphatase)